MYSINSIFLCLFINSFFVTKVFPGRQRALINLKTSFGEIIGTEEITDFGKYPKAYHAYRGIPFALPPVGSLRWRDPILARPRLNISYATNHKPICPQWGRKKINYKDRDVVLGKEDCLYLNVYVSQPVVAYKNVLLPVLVFIHGGAFMVGSSPGYGPEKLMTQDIILVTIQYRLGSFGYLSTADYEMPGNFGSLDQITALKWIQKYIKDFGGNRLRVTIFGNSAGSLSVHQLLLSPLAKGLFHAAIMQSGTTFCESAVIKDPLTVSRQIAAGLFCPIHNGTESMVRCLKTKSVKQVMKEQHKLTPKWLLPIHLAPVVDGHSRTKPFLPQHPHNLPIINQVPILLGMTRDEGLFLYVNMISDFTYEDLDSFTATKNKILPHFLKSILKEDRDYVIQKMVFKIIQFYRRFRYDSIGGSIQMLNGLFMDWCQRKTLENLSTSSKLPVFSYVFGHREKSSPTFSKPAIRDVELKGIEHPFFDYGVGHQDELYYLFQMNEDNPMEFSDHEMVRVMTEIFSTFSTLGSPATAIESFIWPPWIPAFQSRSKINSYFIHLYNPHNEFDFRKQEFNFFNYITHVRENNGMEFHNQNYTRLIRNNEQFYKLE